MYNRAADRYPHPHVPAAKFTHNRWVPLHATDSSGRQVPLYVEVMETDPQTGQQIEDRDARFWCPSCTRSLLNDQGVQGVNNMRVYKCSYCNVSWKTSDDLMKMEMRTSREGNTSVEGLVEM